MCAGWLFINLHGCLLYAWQTETDIKKQEKEWKERDNKTLPLNILHLLERTCNAEGKDEYHKQTRNYMKKKKGFSMTEVNRNTYC